MAYSPARRKYTIVGIDPGTTIGVAIIDLEGKPIEVFSSKNYSCSDVIERIISRGNPLIVASDVTPTPSTVKRISRIFSSPVHELDESLSTEEKVALTKGEGYEYKNVHERDALAACVNAFRRYKKKFSQVQKKTPTRVDREEVKALVVKGVSISAAINRLIRAEEEKKKGTREVKPEQEEKKGGEEDEDENILRLRRIMKGKDEKIEMLEDLTTALKAKVEEKEIEIKNLRSKMDSVKSVRRREIEETEEIKRRDREIERLREEVKARDEENAELRKIMEELKGKKEVNVKGGKRIKLIKSFSRAAILDTDRKYGLKKGDIVFLEDGSGGGASTVELLAKKGVAAVIYGKELSHFAADKFFEFDIPAFSTDEIPLLLNEGDFAFIDQHLLNEKIEEWRERKNFCAQGKPHVLYRGYAI
jgi:predicted RNase H-like nuclease (RuvC/YqgF family)